MEPIASYRAARLLPYLEYLEAVGAPVERGLRLARLPTGLADRAEMFLPTIPTIGFLKWACRREGTDHLALRALQRRLRTCGLSYSDLIDEVRCRGIFFMEKCRITAQGQ